MKTPIHYTLRSLQVRWRLTALAGAGIAVVVAVFTVLLGLAGGFRLALRASGRLDNALLTQRGSQSELTSAIPREQAERLSVDARVKRDDAGRPLASAELVMATSLPRRSDGRLVNVLTRGVSPLAFDVRGPLRLLSGRRFTPGLNEVIVGQRVTERVRGVELGSQLRIQGALWDVVGVFAAEGSGLESEIWGDAGVLGEAFQRSGWYQTLVLRLDDSQSLDSLSASVAQDPALQLDVAQERRYYDQQAGPTSTALAALALFVALAMGVGAVFAAMNTMHGLVAARRREIGALRALGFGRLRILTLFVLEASLLSLAAGLLGCLIALPATSLTGAVTGANFSEVAFAFRITTRTMSIALTLATLIGVAGGLLPAIRAARLPIPEALKS